MMIIGVTAAIILLSKLIYDYVYPAIRIVFGITMSAIALFNLLDSIITPDN